MCFNMTEKYLEPCSKELRKRILYDVGATEESLDEDVNIIYSWIKKQPHLPTFKADDIIKNIIVQCGNSLEKTKRVIELVLMWNAFHPNSFSNLTDFYDVFEQFIQKKYLAIALPKLTPDGYRVFYYKIPETNKMFDEMDEEDFMKASSINVLLTITEDFHKAQILLMDLEHLTVDVATAFVAKFFSLSMVEFVKNMPMRFSQIYVMNLNPKLYWMIDLYLRFTKRDKFKDRIVIWKKKPTDVTEILPRNILPPCLGGNERSEEELRTDYVKFVRASTDVLLAHGLLKADLTKISKDVPLNTINLFENSLDGSFRTLNFD